MIARDPQRVAEVPVDAPMPADIDTPEDYEAARGGPESPAVAARGPLIQWVAGAAPRHTTSTEEPACARRSGRSRP